MQMSPALDAIQKRGVEPISPETTSTVSGEKTSLEKGTVSVETRFGHYDFLPKSQFYMAQGLLGFSQNHKFALGNLPNPQLSNYMVLQSLDKPILTFIVMPIDPNSGLIDAKDLNAAAEGQGIPLESAAFLAMVTLRTQPSGLDMSVNLRAPIVLDLDAHTGRQIVLPNPSYDIKHNLAQMM